MIPKLETHENEVVNAKEMPGQFLKVMVKANNSYDHFEGQYGMELTMQKTDQGGFEPPRIGCPSLNDDFGSQRLIH